jgi:hypothetical protein
VATWRQRRCWRAACGSATAGRLWRWWQHAFTERAACGAVADQRAATGERDSDAKFHEHAGRAASVPDAPTGANGDADRDQHAGSDRHPYRGRHRNTGTRTNANAASDGDTSPTADHNANQEAAHAHRAPGDSHCDGGSGARAASTNRAERWSGARYQPWQYGAADGGADVRRGR